MSGDAELPDLIRAAGDQAVAAYHAFLDQGWTPSTRKTYANNARRFFRWAQGRELTLATISAADITAYADENSTAKGAHVAGVYLTPIRGLFRLLVREGIISVNPFDLCRSAPGGRTVDEACAATAEGVAGPPDKHDGPFPLLSVMAMLAHMEEESLKRIFDEDWAAKALLEFVRWRDDRHCTGCGAAAGIRAADTAHPSTDDRCGACGLVYAVTDGSPFEDSPVPLRLGLFLLYELYLRDGPPPEIESLAQNLGIDAAAATELASNFQEALARDGLAAGEGVRQAVERRDRELTQDEVVRDVVEYGELEAARDTLIAARDAGETVPDLPPEMTVEQAIDDIAARIAEHDRYVIERKDGYLVSRLAELGEGDSEGGAMPIASVGVSL
jgi:hypothetical protein